VKKGDNLEELGLDEGIILKWILKNREETGGGMSCLE